MSNDLKSHLYVVAIVSLALCASTRNLHATTPTNLSATPKATQNKQISTTPGTSQLCESRTAKLQVRSQKILIDYSQKLASMQALNAKLMQIKGAKNITTNSNLDAKITAFGVEFEKQQASFDRLKQQVQVLKSNVCESTGFRKSQKQFAQVAAEFKVNYKAGLDLLKNGIRPDLGK